MITKNKCRAKNPARCWKHGTAYKQEIALRLARQEAAKKEKIEKLKFKTRYDLEQNLNMKLLPDGTTVVNVYRSGALLPPVSRGVESNSYSAADNVKPPGRAGRTHGLFASITLGASNRWVRGNQDIIADPSVKKLQVDVDNTYMYDITAWEKASSQYDYSTPEKHDEVMKKYWDTGISLREYLSLWETDPDTYDPRKWEVLVNPQDIKQAKPVSKTKVASFAEDEWEAKETLKILNQIEKEKRLLRKL